MVKYQSYLGIGKELGMQSLDLDRRSNVLLITGIADGAKNGNKENMPL